jgi:hypothetical protein
MRLSSVSIISNSPKGCEDYSMTPSIQSAKTRADAVATASLLVFVAGLSHDAKREQEAVDRIEASIDAANNPDEDDR